MYNDRVPFLESFPLAKVTQKSNISRHQLLPMLKNTSSKQNDVIDLSSADYKPTSQDIISGRGRGHFLHEGNKVYISHLRKNVHNYLSATKRIEKSAIISTLVSSLKDGGFRFLKQGEKLGRWYVLSETEAYHRTAHAIRDLIRKQKGRNKKRTSKTTSRSPSPSPSTSETSTTSQKVDGMSNVENSITMSSEVFDLNSSDPTNNFASLPTDTNPPRDIIEDDSFDAQISEVLSDMMSPRDTLNQNSSVFDIFFELDPNDFDHMLRQMDTETHK